MVLPAQGPSTTASAGSSSPGVPSDRELAARVQAGDDLAFGELFQRYNARLCLYLARLTGNDDLGQDFAQEAFLKAFDALRSTQEEVPYFKSWLYRIAVNLVKDHWRRAKLIRWIPWPWKIEQSGSELHGDTDERESGISLLEGEEMRLALAGPEEAVEEAELVRMALAQVSFKYRPCLFLEIVEELPQREIAQLLKISESSVRRYIQRGYEELCEAYQRLVDEQDMTTKRRSI